MFEEEVSEITVPEVCGGRVACFHWLTGCQESSQSVPETSAPGDIEPQTEEPSVTEGKVEPVIEEPEETIPLVKGMTEMEVYLRRAG